MSVPGLTGMDSDDRQELGGPGLVQNNWEMSPAAVSNRPAEHTFQEGRRCGSIARKQARRPLDQGRVETSLGGRRLHVR
jgi:hypothetical protein